MSVDQTSSTAQRIDKWLWYARFFKSRSLATRFANAGKIRVNRQRINKSSHMVRAGDVLTFALGTRVRVIRIIASGVRRGPATEARTLYEEIEPETSTASDGETLAPSVPRRERGSGRPTKRDRRAIEALRDGNKERNQ